MSGAQQQAAVPHHLNLAVSYAKAGFAIFPCRRANKAPAIAGGFKSATSDPVEVVNMWGGQDHAVGLPCGQANDLTVIDLDVDKTTGEHTGAASLSAVMPELFDANGIPTGPAVTTPSGGRHLFFRFTPELKNRTNYLPSVDIRTQGGYVIAPHSVISAGIYKPNTALQHHLEARSNGEILATLPELPQRLIEALLAGDPKPAQKPALSLSQRAAAAHQRSYDDLPEQSQIEAALAYISPDDWSDWFKVLSALKTYPNGSAIAREWAAGSTKHTEKVFADEWEKDTAIPVREIFDMAKKNGANLAQIARDGLRASQPDEVEQARLDAVAAEVAAQFDKLEAAKNVVPIRIDLTPAPAPAQLPIQTAAAFTADFVAPEYIVQGVIPSGRLLTFTAPTGHGKTAVCLYLAFCIANGWEVDGREVEKSEVLFLAGENPDDVRARLIASADHLGGQELLAGLHVIAGVFSIRQARQQLRDALSAMPEIRVVVVDTLAAYFDGSDSNSNQDMLDFARVLRGLTEMGSKPVVIVPAHPVKNATKTNLIPLGGSAMLNEVDGNLSLWKSNSVVEMHTQGKFRGPEFEPMKFELETIVSDKVRDRKGRHMPTVIAKPLLETRAIALAKNALSIEDRLLLSIANNPDQSLRDRCVELGVVNGDGKAKETTLRRHVDALAGHKLVKKTRKGLALTDAGKKELETIRGEL